MSNYTLSRTGHFRTELLGANSCGASSAPFNKFRYEVHLTVRELDSRGFVVETGSVEKVFTSIKRTDLSCEMLATATARRIVNIAGIERVSSCDVRLWGLWDGNRPSTQSEQNSSSVLFRWRPGDLNDYIPDVTPQFPTVDKMEMQPYGTRPLTNESAKSFFSGTLADRLARSQIGGQKIQFRPPLSFSLIEKVQGEKGEEAVEQCTRLVMDQMAAFGEEPDETKARGLVEILFKGPHPTPAPMVISSPSPLHPFRQIKGMAKSITQERVSRATSYASRREFFGESLVQVAKSKPDVTWDFVVLLLTVEKEAKASLVQRFDLPDVESTDTYLTAAIRGTPGWPLTAHELNMRLAKESGELLKSFHIKAERMPRRASGSHWRLSYVGVPLDGSSGEYKPLNEDLEDSPTVGKDWSDKKSANPLQDLVNAHKFVAAIDFGAPGGAASVMGYVKDGETHILHSPDGDKRRMDFVKGSTLVYAPSEDAPLGASNPVYVSGDVGATGPVHTNKGSRKVRKKKARAAARKRRRN